MNYESQSFDGFESKRFQLTLVPFRWTALFPVLTTKTLDTVLQPHSLPLPLRLQSCRRHKINSSRRVLGSRKPVQRAALHVSGIFKYHCRLPLFASLDNAMVGDQSYALPNTIRRYSRFKIRATFQPPAAR